MWGNLIQILTGLGGLAGLAALAAALMQRRKIQAEAEKVGADAAQVLTQTALGMLTLAKQESESVRAELAALRHHVGLLEGLMRGHNITPPPFVWPQHSNGVARTST